MVTKQREGEEGPGRCRGVLQAAEASSLPSTTVGFCILRVEGREGKLLACCRVGGEKTCPIFPMIRGHEGWEETVWEEF